MISRLLFALQKAALYVKNHPQILFVLILLVAFPLLFLYTGQQFLDVGRANQERLQKDRVGLMHDVFSSMLFATNFDTAIVQKELDKLKSKVAASAGNDLVNQAELVGQVQVLASVLDGADAKSLRDTVDQLRNKLGQSVVVLATVQDGKVSLAAGVSADVMTRVKAGELVSYLAAQVGGKGGGRPDMAMAGGSDVSALPAALASVKQFVNERVN